MGDGGGSRSTGATLAAALLSGVLIGGGVAAGGYFIGHGFATARTERFVSVKGLAERDVTSDLAVWTVSYAATGRSITDANTTLSRDQITVMRFATAHGFKSSEIEVQPTTVTDTFANQMSGRETPNPDQRFVIHGGIRIRSGQVTKVRQASQDSGELVGEGVALGENYPQAPQYFFTRLNDIRPAMLADATRSARAVAEQFATDSQSELGPIRRASQGVFQITGRDSSPENGMGDDSSSLEKKVRLVSTVDYLLIAR